MCVDIIPCGIVVVDWLLVGRMDRWLGMMVSSLRWLLAWILELGVRWLPVVCVCACVRVSCELGRRGAAVLLQPPQQQQAAN
jgi:hypothetical protein